MQTWYPNFPVAMWDGTVSAADTFKMLLVTDSYGFFSSHTVRSDVTGEVTGGGYTAGGTAVTDIVFSLVGDGANFTWSPVVFPGASFTARGAIVYCDKGAAGSDVLMFYFDFGSDKVGTGTSFIVGVPDPLPRAALHTAS